MSSTPGSRGSPVRAQLATAFEIGLPTLFIVILVALRHVTLHQDAYRVRTSLHFTHLVLRLCYYYYYYCCCWWWVRGGEDEVFVRLSTLCNDDKE